MKVSVVIPTINEEKTIRKVIESIPYGKLKNMGLETEVLVIDGNSTDKTREEAAAAGARVVIEEKLGYGNAYLRGFKEASGDIIVMLDGDATYPSERIPDLLEPILKNEADLVIGKRAEMERGAMPCLHRYIGNPLLNFAFRLLFRAKLTDVNSGMRAISRKALEKLTLTAPEMEFAAEMLVEAVKRGLRIREVPIEYRRREGESKLKSFKHGWRNLRIILVHSPRTFLIPGSILFSLGWILMLLLLKGPVKIGGIGLGLHSMELASLFIILGFQAMVMGIYTDLYSTLIKGYKPGKIALWFLKKESLDKWIIVGMAIFATGFILGADIFLQWASLGFGELDQVSLAIFASTLMIFGVQIVFSSLFITPLLLGRRK